MGARGRSTHGLTHAGPRTLHVVQAIRDHDGPVTRTWIQLVCGISYSHAADIVNRLIHRGVVEKPSRGVYALAPAYTTSTSPSAAPDAQRRLQTVAEGSS